MRIVMRSWFCCAVGACMAMMAAAANAAEPGYFRVVGVSAGDTLNVRAEPTAAAEIVAELAPGASPVEVLEVTNTGSAEWGRVLAADGNGWVSMKFLGPITVPTIGETSVPVGLVCAGAEPFWDAEFTAGGLRLSSTGQPDLLLPIETAISAIARNHRFAIVARQGQSRITTALGRFEQCSDGMSDRDYGWRADMLVEGSANAPYALEGCCRLPLR